ncbi:hypothetical protein B1C78_06720 [Thioalkalivibrio denitrificans]|uniref:Uncharacterized protein n=1 Tax=Thioalkalivibrio denitrificans TaxID=108003 RepID=A0A1V3NK94_9GAMM|nr:hypothetical protein [Thioalkalivibrio denitrificans]OOG25404.1 hypothetical protein B1C78_06720 [Thioalkalivibrio denitrificans]
MPTQPWYRPALIATTVLALSMVLAGCGGQDAAADAEPLTERQQRIIESIVTVAEAYDEAAATLEGLSTETRVHVLNSAAYELRDEITPRARSAMNFLTSVTWERLSWEHNESLEALALEGGRGGQQLNDAALQFLQAHLRVLDAIGMMEARMPPPIMDAAIERFEVMVASFWDLMDQEFSDTMYAADDRLHELEMQAGAR